MLRDDRLFSCALCCSCGIYWPQQTYLHYNRTHFLDYLRDCNPLILKTSSTGTDEFRTFGLLPARDDTMKIEPCGRRRLLKLLKHVTHKGGPGLWRREI